MFHKILVPLDGSALAERALPHAVRLARAFGAEVHVLHVLESLPPCAGAVDVIDWELARAESQAYVQASIEALRRHGVEATGEVEEGPGAGRILDQVFRHGADLIVLTTHGKGGPSEFWAAGTTQKLVSHLPVSVLLVPVRASSPRDAEPVCRRVVVPVDCSRRAESGVRIGSQLAGAFDAELVLVHVVPIPELTGPLPLEPGDIELRDRIVERNRAVAEQALAAMCAAAAAPGIAVRSVTSASADVAGEVAAATLRTEPDLVIVCAHGSNARSERRCGEVALRLVSEADVPLLVFQDAPAAAWTPRASRAGATAQFRVGFRGR